MCSPCRLCSSYTSINEDPSCNTYKCIKYTSIASGISGILAMSIMGIVQAATQSVGALPLTVTMLTGASVTICSGGVHLVARAVEQARANVIEPPEDPEVGDCYSKVKDTVESCSEGCTEGCTQDCMEDCFVSFAVGFCSPF